MKKIRFYLIISFVVTFLLQANSVMAAETSVIPYSGQAVVKIESGSPCYLVPDINSDMVAVLPVNTCIQLQGMIGTEWYQAVIGEGVFYIPSAFLSVSGAGENIVPYVTPDFQKEMTYIYNTCDEANRELHDAFSKHADVINLITYDDIAFITFLGNMQEEFTSKKEKRYSDYNVLIYYYTYGAFLDNGTYGYLITFEIMYRDTFEEEVYLEYAVASMIPQIKAIGNRYEQIKYVHDFICNNADYVGIKEYDEKFNAIYGCDRYVYDSAFECLTTKKSICAGYALLFQKFMEQLEIPCYAVVNEDESHMWNLVYVDDKWYQMDATWDGENSWTIYDYFLFGKDARHTPMTTIAYSEYRHN